MSLRTRLLRSLISVLLTALLLGLAWIWLTLHWSYADGNYAGQLQDFKRQGWICKTWEGVLALDQPAAPGVGQFRFTVRDEALAQQLSRAKGEHLRLNYREYRLIPSDCFGETGNFVVAVEVLPALPSTLLSSPLPSEAPRTGTQAAEAPVRAESSPPPSAVAGEGAAAHAPTPSGREPGAGSEPVMEPAAPGASSESTPAGVTAAPTQTEAQDR